MSKNASEHLKKVLKQKLQGYVLITCEPSGEKGEMVVEMSYEGDNNLISYLLKGAQFEIDYEDEHRTNSPQLSIVSLPQQ